MRTLLSLLALASASWASAQQTAFQRLPVDDALKLAEAKGTYVVLDFYATWCGPCNKMDREVWSDTSVQALQAPLVNVRLDVRDFSRPEVRRYNIHAIPALVVLDAAGEEIYREVGYHDLGQTRRLLSGFQLDLAPLYAARRGVEADGGSFSSYYRVAGAARDLAYAAAAPRLRGRYARELATAADALSEVLAAQQTPPAPLLERVDLLSAEALLLRGRARKALKAVAARRDAGLTDKNRALGCYIEAAAYRAMGKPELAGDCYERLVGAPDNEEYAALYEATAGE